MADPQQNQAPFDLDGAIQTAAQKYDLPAEVLHSMVHTESRGNQQAVSPRGAIGYMQLMPGTARDMQVNPYDPAQNIDGGARYLRQQVDKYGDLNTALAAYNWGPHHVDTGHPVPKMVKDYIDQVREGARSRYAASQPAAAPTAAPSPAPNPSLAAAGGPVPFSPDIAGAPATDPNAIPPAAAAAGGQATPPPAAAGQQPPQPAPGGQVPSTAIFNSPLIQWNLAKQREMIEGYQQSMSSITQQQQEIERQRANVGTLGKILDIAGNIMIPRAMASIPGTELYRESREAELEKQAEQLAGGMGAEAKMQEAIAKMATGGATTAQEYWQQNINPILTALNRQGLSTQPGDLDKSLTQARASNFISPDQAAMVKSWAGSQTSPYAQYTGALAREQMKRADRSYFYQGKIVSGDKVPADAEDAILVKNPEKFEQDLRTNSSILNSFNRYQESFNRLAGKRTADDMKAFEVLTEHKDRIAANLLSIGGAGVGVGVGTGIADLLYGEPFTGYSERLFTGAMKKEQYDKMSYAGKKLLADYSHAIVANFINMKQAMGTAGSRSAEMVAAEMDNVPLPYVDTATANARFGDTIEDFSGRHPEIQQLPKQQYQQPRRVLDVR